jgi:hydrogenase maturation protease
MEQYIKVKLQKLFQEKFMKNIQKIKVLCLGNEFIKEDSFALKIAEELSKEIDNFEFIKIKDSFELVNYLQEGDRIIILDVVEGLKESREIGVEDLKDSKIMTAHDFDAGFFLKLIADKKNIKIIGIPMEGDINKIKEKVKEFLIYKK